MALTPAEHQRRHREKKKKELEAAGDQTLPYLERPFSEFYHSLHDDVSDASTLETYAAHSGIELDYLNDDTDIDFGQVHPDYRGFEPGWLGPHGNSLAKAERMLETFRAGHRVFAAAINLYKRTEIEARIAELEASDLTDAAVRKAALADIVKLNKILDRLKKEVRLSFPVTEVKG